MLVPLDLLAPGSPAGGVTLREGTRRPRGRHMVESMYLDVGPATRFRLELPVSPPAAGTTAQEQSAA